MTSILPGSSGDTVSPVILYEDDDVVAVDKPVGLASIPGRGAGKSLLELLEEYYQQKVFTVHRLDKPVSGVILFARRAQAHRQLNAQFSERAIVKHYLSVVHGRIDGQGGSVDAPLRQFGSGRMAVDVSNGKPSATAYEVVERLTGSTVLSVRPVTGRRHQIRVHLYSIGHAVIGDRMYGDKAQQARYRRLMLHASSLRCSLPSGAEVTFEAPLPESFTDMLETLRGGDGTHHEP